MKGGEEYMARKAKKHTDDIEVKVAQTGGEVKVYLLEEGDTVETALEKAGINADSAKRIRVNGDAADLDDELEDGDRITVSGKIKGGRG